MRNAWHWLIFIAALFLTVFLYWYGQHASILKNQLKQAVNLGRQEAVNSKNGPKNLSGQAILLKEIGTGKVIYQYNAGSHFFPASLSKLMSAVVILENLPDFNAATTVSRKATQVEGGGLDLEEGEQFKIVDLFKMMLVASSNKAAYALAEEVGLNKFVGLMNQKAQELGLKDTGFFDPTGLDEKGNFSTAYDLAALAEYIYQYHPIIGEITRQESVKIYSLNDKREHTIMSTDALLGRLPDIILAKTGYTPNASECFLVVYYLKGQTFVSVVLSSQDRFNDTLKIYRWLKDNFPEK